VRLNLSIELSRASRRLDDDLGGACERRAQVFVNAREAARRPGAWRRQRLSILAVALFSAALRESSSRSQRKRKLCSACAGDFSSALRGVATCRRTRMRQSNFSSTALSLFDCDGVVNGAPTLRNAIESHESSRAIRALRVRVAASACR
jgi:hypothetical protein